MSEFSDHSKRRTLAVQFVDGLQGAVGVERNEIADTRLGVALCFIAGGVNAGGFLAVGQYTSHMSGVISSLADNLALGATHLVLGGLGALTAFLLGAACSAFLIHWGRRHRAYGQYAFPLVVEAILLLLFGLIGGLYNHRVFFVPVAIPLLCFIMGLQNAIITKISRARIRTTHLTGMVTDLGIELGKLFYWNRTANTPGARVVADRTKLSLLCSLLGAFLTGGLAGAYGFHLIGFAAVLPLSTLLLILAGVPLALRHPGQRYP
ncbi:YoaK family protein [Labrys neptuniae]|uniref:YoaK family protein n=1 Tax=Labrys neptuniae TaxID=376174 RepID=UPI0035D7911F